MNKTISLPEIYHDKLAKVKLKKGLSASEVIRRGLDKILPSLLEGDSRDD